METFSLPEETSKPSKKGLGNGNFPTLEVSEPYSQHLNTLLASRAPCPPVLKNSLPRHK